MSGCGYKRREGLSGLGLILQPTACRGKSRSSPQDISVGGVVGVWGGPHSSTCLNLPVVTFRAHVFVDNDNLVQHLSLLGARSVHLPPPPPARGSASLLLQELQVSAPLPLPPPLSSTTSSGRLRAWSRGFQRALIRLNSHLFIYLVDKNKQNRLRVAVFTRVVGVRADVTLRTWNTPPAVGGSERMWRRPASLRV